MSSNSDNKENVETRLSIKEETEKEQSKIVTSLLRPEIENEAKSGTIDFEEFIDERILISKDIFGGKEMKIKVLEVSDENQRSQILWKFGDRAKINKILITIKHLETQQVEEAEFDIEAIEKELVEKRHYSSSNRWVPVSDIKNGYVVGSRHMLLASDAIALDYLTF